MSKGINVLDDTVLANFLGVDGIEELRSKLIDMIVEEVHEQLQQSSDYIISPEDIANDLYADVIEDIKEEILAEYKEKVSEAVEQKMKGLGI